MIANSQLITSIVLLLVLLMGSLFSLLETAAVAISEHKLEALKDQKIWARYAYLLKKELEKVLIFSLFGNISLDYYRLNPKRYFLLKRLVVCALCGISY